MELVDVDGATSQPHSPEPIEVRRHLQNPWRNGYCA